MREQANQVEQAPRLWWVPLVTLVLGAAMAVTPFVFTSADWLAVGFVGFIVLLVSTAVVNVMVPSRRH